jgi:superfamily II DNA or RNA helicase
MVKAKMPPDWLNLPLWDHQREAAEMLESYFNSNSNGSALVRMPTGTGKTRIIAVTTRCFSTVKTSLVICPYRGLSDQLARDILADPTRNQVEQNAEWCEALNKAWPRKVLPLRPSKLGKTIKAAPEDGCVLVSTIQALQQIYADDKLAYASLRDLIDAVVFDEGHREPAPEWATAVRELGKPTILFTATPYRNDHLLFSVDPSFVYVFTHELAERDNYIRHVDFTEDTLPTNPQAFVDRVLEVYDSSVTQKKPSGIRTPRVIIRCETENSVSQICRALKLRGKTFLGIHDRFDNEEVEGKAHKVPDPKKRTETFWVHQFKLLEGIDEPDFCFLAIYEPLKNARSLVQQVGRIIRNTRRLESQLAFVLCRTGDGQKAYWEGYRKYESQFEKSPRRYEIRQIFDVFTELQMEYQYYDRDYRQRFGIDEHGIHQSFLYRPSALVFKAPSRLDWDELQDELTLEWVSGDRDVRNATKPDPQSLLLPYIFARNSPILRNRALTEIQLGFCILRRSHGYLFVHDTEGSSSTILEERFERVSPDKLERLFSGNAKLNYVSLLNSDLGKQSTRRRTIQAYSIHDTAPGLLDHAHFASSVVGSAGEAAMLRGQRYVGLSRARVSDRLARSLEYKQFCAWTDSIANELTRQRRALAIFSRYAMFSAPPGDTKPVNILLDISDVMSEFVFSPKEKNHQVLTSTLDLEDICIEIEQGRFDVETKSGRYNVGISYDKKRKRYILDSPELEAAYQLDRPGSKPENLVHYLNRNQSFRVVPESRDTVFAWGRFYRPRNPLTGRRSSKRIEVLNILETISELQTRISEKGAPGSANGIGWSDKSLFHLIATRGKNSELQSEFDGVNILVCDDMQTECADFLAANSAGKRVMFIHAKAKGSRLSASALQDVCGQATKNLGFLSPYNQSKPSNLSRWNGKWKGGRIGIVDRRILLGTRDGENLWEQIQLLLRDPSTSREVWILLGNTLSLSEFERSRTSPNPSPETIQILFLLQSTWANVSSVGARLRVFCSP